MRFTALVLSLIPVAAHAQSLWSWRGTDIPGPRRAQSNAPSACANGPSNAPAYSRADARYVGANGAEYAFACPHQMLLTNDMRAAAARDGLNASFVYALAGCATDAECGACYQVRLVRAEKVWRSNFPMLVVQCANSGFDVMPGQMDLYVGAGGQGHFTCVNSDCRTRFCNGGACKDNLYETSFAAWTDAEFPDPNRCYSGGVKQFNNATRLREKCARLTGGRRDPKHANLYDSCVRTNTAYLHQNFYETAYERVRCPDSLARISGMRRQDDASFPSVHRGNVLKKTCKGSIESGHACITTMHDGCVQSCSWPGKVNTVAGYPSVTRCDKAGRVLG